jgi:hypothetical protein
MPRWHTAKTVISSRKIYQSHVCLIPLLNTQLRRGWRRSTESLLKVTGNSGADEERLHGLPEDGGLPPLE